ncbi:Na+/H+ antiporter subunit E [Kocuria rosea]|uniref:Na+/H+ antiporter subunit E n=1 Tax=Kocuria rosea TaxID=1275 RepID=A0A4R5YMW4_KOCRO|nr:Na+/H+ antiporter subunit E [Kocuria rosea]
MTRPKNSLLVELPLLVWLVVVWGALWGDFGPGNLLVGLVLALLVTWVLYLPPVQLSGRFNPFQFALFAVTFVWQVAKASFEVMLIAILVGPRARNAVVGVQLRTRSDLLLTATGHTMTLIPGSLVVEVDRASGTLYFHALNVRSAQEAEDFRRSALQVEAAWIRIMGSPEELAALRAERRGGRASGTDRRDSAALSSPVTASQQIVGRRRDEVPTGSPADAPGPTPTDAPQEDRP